MIDPWDSFRFPILFLCLLYSFFVSSAQPNFRFSYCDNNNGNYTNSSSYVSNLNNLLAEVTSQSGVTGFYNLTSGANLGIGEVYGIALCRGDQSPSECKSCLSNAAGRIRTDCPNQMEAIGWYNECMLRYSSNPIFGTTVGWPRFVQTSTTNVTDPSAFNQTVGRLLHTLQDNASAGDSGRKFAAGGPIGVTDFINVYGLVQCTPDSTTLDCGRCIGDLISLIPSCCPDKIGITLVTPSCNLRYEITPFFNVDHTSPSPISPSSIPPSNSTLPGTTGESNSNKGKLAIVVAVLAGVACLGLIAIIFGCWFLRRKRWKKIESSSSIHETEDHTKSIESLRFDFATMRKATNNFSSENKLGRGGFGTVYKGTLSNGRQVAVKRLAKNSSQGEQEFKNEVLLVANLQHRNLVKLLGFCLDGDERLLIYQYLPNSSLDHILFDPVRRAQLDWQMRYKIITGIARGLLYLHEDSQLRIIHRDLKASNVLLDSEMNAKIADFGLAKLFQMDQTHGDTNRVVGTYGYMAPEYAFHGLFSPKSDVYSFGVLVLEMVTGRRSIGLQHGEDSEDITSYVWKNWRDGTAMNVVDEAISGSWRTEIMKCIHMGMLCVQEEAAERPTMSAVVVMMSSVSFTFSVPSHPPFVTRTMNLLDTDASSGAMSQKFKTKSRQESAYEDSASELFPR